MVSIVDGASKNYVLAVCFKSGDIDLMNNYDDICPRHIRTGLTGKFYVSMYFKKTCK